MSIRFPNIQDVLWNKMRECISSLQDFARDTDAAFDKIESDQDITEAARKRKLGIEGKVRTDELTNWPALKDAEREVETALNRTNFEFPSTDKNGIWAEIRAHVKVQQPSPFSYAGSHLGDPDMVGAIINAPAFLSGMTDEQVNLLRQHASIKLFPDQVDERKRLEWALDICKKAVEQTKTLIESRAGATRFVPA